MRARTPILAALLAIAGLAPAAAQGLRAVEPYAPPAHSDHRGGYAYADEFVRGSYVGAPLTRFPRPSQIVPTPWSYGTYGIPTVSGIEAAPAGQPTLTVVNARGPRVRGGDPAGVRVIEVTVPRR